MNNFKKIKKLTKFLLLSVAIAIQFVLPTAAMRASARAIVNMA